MTYYSDQLCVIAEIERLGHGLTPSRPVHELQALCRRLLAIEPDDELATHLLRMLDEMPVNVRLESLWVFVAERLRQLLALRRSRT